MTSRASMKVGEPAPEGGGEVELAVGEGARAAEAAHGVAHVAVDAALHLAGDDGAAAVVDVRPWSSTSTLAPGHFKGLSS